MISIQANAGNQLDRAARNYMAQHRVDYRTALYAVVKSNDGLSHRYNYGENTVKRYDDLTPAQKAMQELLADPEKTRRLASELLDKLARQKIVNVGKGIEDPIDAYRRALSKCKREYPNLARAAADGFIADTDFKLLGMLVPAVAGEVEKVRYSHDTLDAITKRYF